MRSRFSLLAGLTLLALIPLQAQDLAVTVHVFPGGSSTSISPLIYGTNGQSDDRDIRITARRLGGNRMTGYNWENNASNMGMDYDQSNSNDNYMTWVMGIPSAQENVPGIVLRAFHDTSLSMSCYSLLTLPAAGFVSRDKGGSVTAAETAPSPRWRRVVTTKGSSLSATPDTADTSVAVDEEVNALVSRYGGAGTPTGVKGYAVDNEPALWPSTHPRIHPQQTTCAEVIAKNVALAKAVKSVDPDAEIFGGVFYGFNEYYNMQNAPDFGGYENQGWFINGFLGALRDSSVAAGRRLIDVLDLHWYPDLYHAISQNENTDSLTVWNRVHAPRSLWDSTYVEDGWIGQWFSPVSLLPNVQTSIAKKYPGTKLAITEFNYGGATHVSGGIALADVLGIFGKYGVYFASHWGAVTGYLRSAYALYRNYDGEGSAFGDAGVRAATSDSVFNSAYAALRTGQPGVLDLVVMNKHFSRTMDAHIVVEGGIPYSSAEVFGFDGVGEQIVALPSIVSITEDTLTLSLPPLSVRHLVFHASSTAAGGGTSWPGAFRLEQNYPNPCNPSTMIVYTLAASGRVLLVVYDILGREVCRLVDAVQPAGEHRVRLDATRMASGAYLYRLTGGGKSASRMLAVLH